MRSTDYDVVIVGGGPAGLSAAVALGRSLRSVLVVDAGRPRNAPAAGAHNVLGHEGIPPAELLARGRDEARGYGVEIRAGEVADATRDGDGFTFRLADGDTVTARRLLLAAGLVDELPDVPGVADLWGSSVLHCPYCHGWEVRGQRIGVLGTGAMSVHQTLMFARLSDDITLFTHTMTPEPEQVEQLSALGVRIVEERVERLGIVGDTLRSVVLADGRAVERDALLVAPRFVVRSELFTRLGGELADHPMGGQHIPTGPMGATDLPGVWAAGNVADLSATVAVSMGAGVSAGAAINADLIAADVRTAIAAARV
ncbi:NAD(P)/FAD-dependent oxidoreductase [Gordonia rhizosphera]|uniref:Putative oxidoreductase n=1 Tax=Gordonia rhizosphera NBRC 16068 TaxID=1108045 RepID=K6UZJ7_9ACTN|nr:NAD(P)/FAD-dependent oxidoreductase [Gordonia rhizosphera]GAB88928.1 putative oxidoreductase [Gordonia rhizosphera NBRC 16068]